TCPDCRVAVDALADCVEESDRISTILKTLVDIAEAEAGLVKLELVPVPLARLVAAAVESYSEFAEERAVAISIDVPPELSVRADAAALFRVFANLLDNAIKYTPAGGRIRIEAQPRGDAVEVRFADTGVGIAPEDLPHIWDRLFRGDRSRAERGMGLGLSFVRAIVEAHGGSVSVESQVGTGTIVRLTLLDFERPLQK
ncbi:MAG TPA: HAMP domain-containing sensor histidine kinase, partial [Chthoniobacteraceae bacterium]|nr:HAMP domain-containing sensor histidine kinase [Chthoniobacteraceae bacterium]